MKKKTRKILLPVILFLILMAMMPVQAQAANRTATTVRMKTYYKSGKKFMTVRGLDSRSRLVWKYTTKSYPATELKQITCLVRADKVYVFESSKVIAFRKKDGRRLWSTSKISPAGHIFGFDRYDNLYVTENMPSMFTKYRLKERLFGKQTHSEPEITGHTK